MYEAFQLRRAFCSLGHLQSFLGVAHSPHLPLGGFGFGLLTGHLRNLFLEPQALRPGQLAWESQALSPGPGKVALLAYHSLLCLLRAQPRVQLVESLHDWPRRQGLWRHHLMGHPPPHCQSLPSHYRPSHRS